MNDWMSEWVKISSNHFSDSQQIASRTTPSSSVESLESKEKRLTSEFLIHSLIRRQTSKQITDWDQKSSWTNLGSGWKLWLPVPRLPGSSCRPATESRGLLLMYRKFSQTLWAHMWVFLCGDDHPDQEGELCSCSQKEPPTPPTLIALLLISFLLTDQPYHHPGRKVRRLWDSGEVATKKESEQICKSLVRILVLDPLGSELT